MCSSNKQRLHKGTENTIRGTIYQDVSQWHDHITTTLLSKESSSQIMPNKGSLTFQNVICFHHCRLVDHRHETRKNLSFCSNVSLTGSSTASVETRNLLTWATKTHLQSTLCLCLTVECRMIPSVQCMHTHTHTHSLLKTSWHSLAWLVNSSLNPVCLFVAKILQSSSHIHPTLCMRLFPRTSMASSTLTLLQKNPQTQTQHTQTQPRPLLSLSLSLSLSLWSWSCWVFLKQNLFPTLFLFGFVDRRTKLLKSTDPWTRRCSQANPNPYVRVSVWRCAESLSLSVQCPSRKSDVPTSQLSIVSTTTLSYFFRATNVLIEWGKKKLALWVHQSQENKTKQKNLKMNQFNFKKLEV